MSTLWKHQIDAIKRSAELPNLALFMDTGVGKTRTTIEILRRKYAGEKRILRTLIISPIITLENWKSEFKVFSKVDQRDIIILNGSGKTRVGKIMKWLTPAGAFPQNRIVVTNYECMQMEEVFELLRAWGPEVLVCDESHRCKNHDSMRAKRVVAIADHCKHKYILTGTPILNTPMDIFNQFRILDGGKSFGQNFWAFRNKYFEDENASWSGKENYFPKYVPRADSYATFSSIVSSSAIRAIKSQCLDLPPLVRKTIYVELSKEQEKMYSDMKRDYVAYIEEKQKSGDPLAVVAQLVITRALRLMQILSGYGALDGDEDGNGKGIHVIKDNPRLAALTELLEDITPGNKVIVWACFKQNYIQIKDVCKKLNLGYAEIHGEIKDKQAEMYRFRTDPTCKVMVANQQAGGVGINLIEASYSIYYSRNFSLEADLQSEARNYRGGSEVHEKITRIDLVAKETIDELIADVLANKLDVATRILSWKL